MLPESVFDPLLRSFSLSEPSPPHAHAVFEATPQSGATDGGRSFLEPSIRIWHELDGKISFDRFRDKLRDELRKRGHKHTDGVIGAVVALYASNPARYKGPTSTLNAMLSKIVDVDLSQFFIFPHPPFPGFRTFKIGQFTVGELDSRKLEHRSARAGSDYFTRYEKTLVGRFAIERDVISVRVFDRDEFTRDYNIDKIGGTPLQLWWRCINTYFQTVADAYFDEFWKRLMEDQHLIIACGSSYMDERYVRQAAFDSKSVSVFRNTNSSGGFVAPDSFKRLHG